MMEDRLLKAAFAGDLKTLRRVLESSSPEQESLDQLLMCAAEEGHVAVIEYLVGRGADVNAECPLMFAAANGHLEAVDWLLKHGADVNQTVDGVPQSLALEEAVANEHIDIVKALIQQGAAIEDSLIDEAEGEILDYLLSRRAAFIEPRPPIAVLAAKLPGEGDYLAAVVSNLLDHDAKLRYAAWLESQGDVRCEFLRRFVKALQSGTKLPAPGRTPDDWRRMVGYRLVQQIAESELDIIKDSLLRLARPALKMKFANATDSVFPLGSTKWGGLPDLPPNISWPREKDCTDSLNGKDESELACGFIGQINFAELVGTQASRLLPQRGLLSIFYYYDDTTTNDGIRLHYTPQIENLVRSAAPDSLTEYTAIQPVKKVTFHETIDIPESDGPWASDLPLAEGQYLSEIARDADLLGYEFVGTGADPTPDRTWLHLGSFEVLDSLRFHIQIRDEDLKACQFNAVKIAWIDYD